jgi:hypothetical protein
MGCYAGDTYLIASDKVRTILCGICLLLVLAFLAFLGCCIWEKAAFLW